MKRLLVAVVALMALMAMLISPVPGSAASQFEFSVDVGMDGSQEVPAVDTDMTGLARLTIQPQRLRYRLWAFDSSSEIFAAHIHCASPGANGPVGATLFSGSFTKANGTFASGNLSGPTPGNACGWSDLADMALAIQNGEAYINVHTTADSGGVPSGEIRGDLGANDFEVRVNVDMDGGQENPAVLTEMTGQARLTVKPDRLRYRLTVFDGGSDIFAAHIHCGPPEGNGPVGVTLFSGLFTKANGAFATGNLSAPNPGNGCGWSDLADLAVAVQMGEAYVNVHTTVDSGGVPSGEIRGNLGGDAGDAVAAAAADALGGVEALLGVERVAIDAEGLTAIDYEGETPEETAAGSSYTRNYSFDLVNDDTRVDVNRQLLFEGLRFLPPQSFTIVLDGNVGGISAGAALFGPDGGNLPSRSVAALDRQQVLFNPQAFVLQALLSPQSVGDGGAVELDGVPHHVLRLADPVAEVRLLIDAETGLISKLETTENNSLGRDTKIEVGYDDWQDRGGVQFPTDVRLYAGGQLLWEETRTGVELNPSFPADHFELPDEADSPTFDPVDAQFGLQSSALVEGFFSIGFSYEPQPGLAPAVELLPGVWLLVSGANSLAVEHDGGVVAVEAPASPEHGDQLVGAINALVPDQPITHIVQSHHHVDHSAGLRSLVAAGATAVVGNGVGEFWNDVLSAPSTIRPDSLSMAGVTPTVVELGEGGSYSVAADGEITITAEHLAEAVHSEDMVIVVIDSAGERIIYVADLYNGGVGFTVVLGGPESFFDGLRAKGLIDADCNSPIPTTIVSAHGIPLSLADAIAELNGFGIDIGCPGD